jgi:hypothetical protein
VVNDAKGTLDSNLEVEVDADDGANEDEDAGVRTGSAALEPLLELAPLKLDLVESKVRLLSFQLRKKLWLLIYLMNSS